MFQDIGSSMHEIVQRVIDHVFQEGHADDLVGLEWKFEGLALNKPILFPFCAKDEINAEKVSMIA